MKISTHQPLRADVNLLPEVLYGCVLFVVEQFASLNKLQ